MATGSLSIGLTAGGKATVYTLGECEFKDNMTQADWEQLESDCTVWVENMRPDAAYADAYVRVSYSVNGEIENNG